MKETLLPCPFCGGEAVKEPNPYSPYGFSAKVRHKIDCTITIREGSTPQNFQSIEEIKAWNTRTAKEAEKGKLPLTIEQVVAKYPEQVLAMMEKQATERDKAVEIFICHLIDHCEGDVITEEYLQRQYAELLKGR